MIMINYNYYNNYDNYDNYDIPIFNASESHLSIQSFGSAWCHEYSLLKFFIRVMVLTVRLV